MGHLVDFRTDTLTDSQVIALLREHLASMHLHSPPESIHALDLEGLRQSDVTFWSLWHEEHLLGCCALKQLDPRHGEIKSMRTVTAHLRKGVGVAMMVHLIDEAKRRGYQRLSLETGSMEAFMPARRLYERFGFDLCGPFAEYVEDPFSIYMTLEL